MSYTRGLFQFFTSTVIVIGILTVIGAWYLLAAIGSTALIIAVVIYRSLKARSSKENLSQVAGGRLSAAQLDICANGGLLQLADGNSLRVVGKSEFLENHRWLGQRFQVESAETLEIDGALLAGLAPKAAADQGNQKQTNYVVHRDRVLGQLPDLDAEQHFESVLEVGGAAKAKLLVEFDGQLNLERVKVNAYQAPTNH